MAILQTVPDIGSPWQVDLSRSRSEAAAFAPSIAIGQAAGPAIRLDSSFLTPHVTFECWEEDDHSWAAFSNYLGLTATAESLVELTGKEIPEVLQEFWDHLSEQRATLSPELAQLLNAHPGYLIQQVSQP